MFFVRLSNLAAAVVSHPLHKARRSIKGLRSRGPVISVSQLISMHN